MKLVQWAKEFWTLMPLGFVITLLARIFIGSAVIDVYANMDFEGSIMLIQIVITLWMLSPLYYSIRHSYYEGMGDQTWKTILWNDLTRSIYKLEGASKNAIKQKRLRMWVEKNPEIHILNYWYLKILRRKEWINIDVDEERKEE